MCPSEESGALFCRTSPAWRDAPCGARPPVLQGSPPEEGMPEAGPGCGGSRAPQPSETPHANKNRADGE